MRADTERRGHQHSQEDSSSKPSCCKVYTLRRLDMGYLLDMG